MISLSEPPPSAEMRAEQARDGLLRAALRLLSAERADEAEASYASELEYAREQVDLAARSLHVAVDHLPRGQQPVGWYKS